MNDNKKEGSPAKRNEELITAILNNGELSQEQKVKELSTLKGRAYYEGRDDAAPASKADLRRIEGMLKQYGINSPERGGSTRTKDQNVTPDR